MGQVDDAKILGCVRAILGIASRAMQSANNIRCGDILRFRSNIHIRTSTEGTYGNITQKFASCNRLYHLVQGVGFVSLKSHLSVSLSRWVRLSVTIVMAPFHILGHCRLTIRVP